MEFPAISPSKTLNFPANFARKTRTESQKFIGRTHFLRERCQIRTCITALSGKDSSFSISKACTDASATEPEGSDHSKEWLHFVGVGGCGISALAMLALKQGYEVSGSDLVWSGFLDRLQESGARLHIGHSASNLRSNDNGSRLPNALIISSAIPQNNVEVLHAKSVGIPVYKRDYWLEKLTLNHKLIAVSGSHGKSTTASMLAYVLNAMGDDLTAVVGAEVPQFTEGNVISGSSETFVLEADEYDGCFLKLSPYIAVVTNLDWEHVDIFPDEEAVKNIFRKFLKRIRKDGHLILCGDRYVAELPHMFDSLIGPYSALAEADIRNYSEGAYSLLNRSKHAPMSNVTTVALQPKNATMGAISVLPSEHCDDSYKITTFGVSSSNEWHASSISQNSDGGCDYTLCHWGCPVADIRLQIPGIHNVLNSLAVIAAAVAMVGNKRKVYDTVNHLSSHLKNFRGILRRFEMIGSIYGCHIIDDYAHHPTEIRAVIQATRQSFPSKALLVVFQPHTYSRLAALKDDLAIALSDADQVVITGVYASREADNGNVSGNELSASVVGPASEYIYSLESVVDELVLQICKDPHREIAVLTLGAGDITTVGPKLLNKLQERLLLLNSTSC